MSGTLTLGAPLPAITAPEALTIDGAGRAVTISGNNAVWVMFVERGAALDLRNLTIANGKAPIDDSELGGGVGADFDSRLTVSNSTFTGNSAGFGAAIFNDLATPTTISNSTIAGNNPGDGEVLLLSGATVRNTIVANNTGRNCNPALAGSNTDQGGNLDDQGVCGFTHPTSQNNVPASLAPAGLKDNGGPTQTIALCQGAHTPAGCTGPSAALDAGVSCPPPATGQRGL